MAAGPGEGADKPHCLAAGELWQPGGSGTNVTVHVQPTPRAAVNQ